MPGTPTTRSASAPRRSGRERKTVESFYDEAASALKEEEERERERSRSASPRKRARVAVVVGGSGGKKKNQGR